MLQRSAEIILCRIPQKKQGVLVAKAQFVKSKSGWGKFRTGGVKGVNHLPQG
jgi:hypothetical protein